MTETLRQVVEYQDAAELAADVASRLLARIEELQDDGRIAQLVLTGGTIADAVHREVGRRAPESSVDWSRVALWWGDERFVARDSPDRNAGQAAAAWLDLVPLTPRLVHPMPSTEEADSPAQAAGQYADLLREELFEAPGGGAFDLVMLGLGPDGHVASLFPDRPQVLETATYSGALVVGVEDAPKPPPQRVSLTLRALNRASAVWFLAAGAQKADAVAAALVEDELAEDESAEEALADERPAPARQVHGRAETMWFIDEASGAGRPYHRETPPE